MSFKLEVKKRQDREPIIYLFGELDIYESTNFKIKVLDEVEKYTGDLYLDFTNLDYIDSTGLGELIAILKDLKEDGREVYLIGVNERIRKLFKITQLEEMFKFIGAEDVREN